MPVDDASLWYAVLIAVFALVVALGVLLHRRDAREDDEDAVAPPAASRAPSRLPRDTSLQPPPAGDPDVPEPRPRR